jgi:hypothetical protein
MLSQRRGYDLSPCESRLVELLAQAQCIPKKAGQRSVSAKGAKA